MTDRSEDHAGHVEHEQRHERIAERAVQRLDPRNPQVAAKYANVFPKISTMVTIADFGGWQKAQATYFGDGGVFDKIYAR